MKKYITIAVLLLSVTLAHTQGLVLPGASEESDSPSTSNTPNTQRETRANRQKESRANRQSRNDPQIKKAISNLRAKDHKSISVGFGSISRKYQAEEGDTKQTVQSTTIGLGFGFKSIEDLYQIPDASFNIGYYVGLNTLVGMQSDSFVNNESGDSDEAISLGGQGIITDVSQNLTLGFNLRLENRYIFTSFGVGPSLNLLYSGINTNDTATYLFSTGIGFSTDLQLMFPVSDLLGVTLDAGIAYYPLVFDSYGNGDAKYTTSEITLGTVQAGLAFRY